MFVENMLPQRGRISVLFGTFIHGTAIVLGSTVRSKLMLDTIGSIRKHLEKRHFFKCYILTMFPPHFFAIGAFIEPIASVHPLMCFQILESPVAFDALNAIFVNMLKMSVKNEYFLTT
jgi:hypothetical protein